ncbi:MAG: helix-turn-helix domain-containing protein [Sphingomonas sp.]|nr:helix-turn-helix domain-containing protein [Pirellulales bacterium]MBX9859111.1 helix-turn-helix domain-containing protein [Sphingomonas sp.]
MASRNYVLERYTPAEAEMVTGVNVALQRDWRRRGLLPETGGGHARYNAAELAEMMIMQRGATQGLGPKLLKDMLQTAAMPLASWVESLVRVKDLFSVDCVIPVDQFPASYVVCVAGRAISTADLNETFEALPHDADRHFAFVCNLRRVAEQVVAKVPRPVWRQVNEPGAASR